MTTKDEILGTEPQSMMVQPTFMSPPPGNDVDDVAVRPMKVDKPANAQEVVNKGVVNVANSNPPVVVYDDNNETENAHKIQKLTTQASINTSTPAIEAPRSLSYVDMYEKLNPYKPPTPEDIEKERKKKKRDSIFAAIGDGISALSNLYFTSQYAPNAYDPRSSMSDKMRERYDRLQKEREANRRTYMEGYLRAIQADKAQANADKAWDAQERSWRHSLEREAITDDWKERQLLMQEAKAERDAALADLRMRLDLKKLDGQEYENERKRINAEYAEATARANIGRLNRSNTGIGAAKPKYAVYNKDGDVIDYAWTKEEAVSETERNGGTYPGVKKESTRTTTKGNGILTETTTSSTTNTETPTANRQERPAEQGEQETEKNKKSKEVAKELGL